MAKFSLARCANTKESLKMPQLLLLAVVLIIASVNATNYCDSSLCKRGQRHIACTNNKNFVSTCPKDAKIVDAKPYIKTILAEHNAKRNQIAGGKLKGFEPAKRMVTMQWSPELAELAELNVRQCDLKHDQCHNTDEFKHSGQNIAYAAYYGQNYKDEELIKEHIQDWWDENKDCKMKHIKKYPKNYSGATIGHFTVMAAEKNTHVGCAIARYTDDKKYKIMLFACNYATSNIKGSQVYASGKTATGCKTGISRAYENLCSVKEKY